MELSETQARVALARARAAEAGLHNVSFTLGDVAQIAASRRFDAVVGRLILEFVPDPVAVLRSAFKLIRPGGTVAFHEVSHAPCLALVAHLPLWSAAVAVLVETLKRTGANMEMGLALARVFQGGAAHTEGAYGHGDGHRSRFHTMDVRCAL